MNTDIQQYLDSSAGSALKEFFNEKIDVLKDINNIREYPTAEEQAIEIKAQKKALIVLQGIFSEIMKMEKKIEAGARFFQTQAVYDIDLFEKFIRRVEGFKVPIIGGVILLKSAGMARFMNKNVAGVFVPVPLIKEMTDTKDKVKKSVEIAASIVKRLKDLCQGVHIMALGWEKMIPAVLDQADI